MNLALLTYRLRWLHAPAGLLVLLLQRTPVLRVLVEHEAFLTERAPAILRSVFTVAALGACDTLAGATVFSVTATPTAASPTSGAANSTFTISGATGTAESVTFAVTGAPGTARSWRVTGTLPTGLSVQGGNPVNVSAPFSMKVTGTPTAAGSYPVTVTAYDVTGGSGGNNAKIFVTFNITSSGVAPSFSTQPASQSVTVGGSVTFTVAASGTPAPTLQWKKGAADITGATGSTLTLTNVTTADADAYTCVATNTAGSVTSSAATLTVSKITPTLTWSAPSAITYGTALSTTQLNASSGGVAGSFVYSPASGTVLAAGTGQPLGVTFTPTDSATYNTVTASTTITVNKATPVITWSTPAAITYGTALSATQLNASSGAVAGSFAYSPASGAVLNAGAGQALGVTFTPTDTANYNTATGATTITVNKATPVITWSVPAAISFGTALSATQLNATASVAGTFVYNPSAGSIPAVGTQALGATFTPADTSNYLSASATQSLAVVPAGYLSNLSVRAAYTAGQTLIVGFVVEGGEKPMLVRAAGPALNNYGLTGVTDPRLSLYNGSTLVTQNDDWSASLGAAFATLGAFPFDVSSKDSALQQSINGPHTAQATATNSGQILVEAYDAGPNDTRKLTNLSARFQVGTGDNILIAGFVLAGGGTRQLLVRAIGPTLAAYGVPNTLADPQFSVYDGATAIATNNDWSASLATTFTTLGAFALDSASKDAALVVTLQAGKPYTVQVSGVGGTTGEALVELYLVP